MATREITDVRLEAVENGGLILTYQSKVTPVNPSKYSTVDYKYCKEAFSEEDADKAFSKFKELAGILEQQSGEDDDTDTNELKSEY